MLRGSLLSFFMCVWIKWPTSMAAISGAAVTGVVTGASAFSSSGVAFSGTFLSCSLSFPASSGVLDDDFLVAQCTSKKFKITKPIANVHLAFRRS